MTIRSRGGNQFEGLSTDTKPTDLPKYSRILETDTNNEYILNSSLTWVQIGSGTNPGEANTLSYPGTGGISLVLTKSGVNIPIKGIAAASTKVTVADDATNKNVTIDVNSANLGITNTSIASGAAITDSKLAQITDKAKLPSDTIYLNDTQVITNKTLDQFVLGPSTTTPSNPSATYSRIYVKTVDSNNDGVFALIKKNGGFVEVQIL